MLYVVCCLLYRAYVVRCLLLIGVRSLLCLCCVLSDVCCSLFVVCWLLFVVCCSKSCGALFVVRCLLMIVCSLLFVDCSSLFVVRCPLLGCVYVCLFVA